VTVFILGSSVIESAPRRAVLPRATRRVAARRHSRRRFLRPTFASFGFCLGSGFSKVLVCLTVQRIALRKVAQSSGSLTVRRSRDGRCSVGL